MKHKLVIVESPAKAKTIEKLLPRGCKVVATMGHIIDLPASKLAVDTENNYEPQYRTIRGKSKILNEIKALAKASDEVILATDPDREGEAISYHLARSLNLPLNEDNRIEFHEITAPAIKNAFDNKRSVDMDLVNAQQARRVLDRLVGYQISPVLWKKIMSGLSAGRVQSVATRLIVDREAEIDAFIAQEYWDISALLEKDKTPFTAKLVRYNGKKAEYGCKEDTMEAVNELNTCPYIVGKVKKSKRRRRSYPSYTTSTLQQDANRRLGFTSKKTMMIAQMLYEGVDIPGKGHLGLITYIRTDSTRLSDVAIDAANEYISNNFGKNYLGSVKTAGKSTSAVKAQDAHEAIRPTDVSFTPQDASSKLTRDQAKLYELIYRRFLSSVMADAVYDTVSAEINCGAAVLSANGSHLAFDGFLKVYSTAGENEDEALPELAENDKAKLIKVNSEQKFTQPPARYNEATLVKALEEKGIGRPSTYAPTISTIESRNYVEIKDKKFYPTAVGKAVTKLLCENFRDVIDYDFTAEMENKLDNVAEGSENWVTVVDGFYKDLLAELNKSDDIAKIELTSGEVCEKCGKPMVIRSGRYGQYLACSDYPECKNTRAIGSSAQDNTTESTDEVCEKCGKPMVIKTGRFGKFLACSAYPECKNTKAIENKLDVACPKCGREIVVKKSKKGRVFYGCKGYPECDFVSWGKPTNEKCPVCGGMLTVSAGKGKKKLNCINKECGYSADSE